MLDFTQYLNFQGSYAFVKLARLLLKNLNIVKNKHWNIGNVIVFEISNSSIYSNIKAKKTTLLFVLNTKYLLSCNYVYNKCGSDVLSRWLQVLDKI